jgi:hypothetical protein
MLLPFTNLTRVVALRLNKRDGKQCFTFFSLSFHFFYFFYFFYFAESIQNIYFGSYSSLLSQCEIFRQAINRLVISHKSHAYVDPLYFERNIRTEKKSACTLFGHLYVGYTFTVQPL